MLLNCRFDLQLLCDRFSLGGLDEPTTVDNGPYPSNNKPGGESLEESVEESRAVELAIQAGRDGGAKAGPENVEEKEQEGDVLVEAINDSLLAATGCSVHLSFSLFLSGHLVSVNSKLIIK